MIDITIFVSLLKVNNSLKGGYMIESILSKPEIFWLILGLILFLLELVTPGFFIFFFGLGACVTSLICLVIDPGINMQIIIFAAISILSLLALRKMMKKKFLFTADKESQSIEDEFTGKEAVAITDFDDNNRGKVEFKGTSWNAESNASVKAGQIVKIIEVEGFTLKIELKNDRK